MLRFAVLSLATAVLPLCNALAQPEPLARALEAFINEDYSQISTIARYADDGEAEAIAALGQAYLNGHGVKADAFLGIALLEQADRLGERSSSVQLGRAYEFGTGGIEVDTAMSAHWYVRAARGGDTRSAPAALHRLPREDVLAAGGAPWAAPETTTSAALLIEPLEKDNAPPAAASPASALLGTSLAPPPIVMTDGIRFPVFADTQLSLIADAAASCSVVVTPELEQQAAMLNSLMQLGNTDTVDAGSSRHASLAEADLLVKSLTDVQRAADGVLFDTRRNGGLRPEDVRIALVAHSEALKHRPQTGPGLSVCSTWLIPLIEESAAWPTD